MARVIVSGEQSFQPIDPNNAPKCDKCEYFAYNVFQANCCAAFFCERCYEVQQKMLNCHKCKGPLGQMIHDLNQSKQRLKTVVYCCNRGKGCTDTDVIERMDDHRKKCPFEMVPCKHSKCKKPFLRKVLADHESNCPDQTVTCPYCCDTMRISHYQQFHFMTPGCQRYPKQCRNGCEAKVTDDQWPNHQKICPKETVPCVFSQQGCPDLVLRGKMDEHVRDTSVRHMELLLKEIQLCRKAQLDQTTSYSAEIRRLQETIQTMQNEVRLLKTAASYANQESTVLKKSQEQMKGSQYQLSQQVHDLERNFKSQQEAFQTFKRDCSIMYENINIAKMTPPLKFVVHNIRELTRKGEGQESLCFYTECRGHKLKLKIYPGGKNGTEGQCVSVWLYRINGCGTPSEHFPEQMKLNVLLELVNQLPMANEARENHAVQLDGIVHNNQTGEEETLICQKNDFISINQLEHRRRDTFSLTTRFTQYKKNDSLIFLVKSAGEALI